MTKKEVTQLSYEITGFAIKVHKTLGPGLLESIYEECLKIELIKNGYDVAMVAPQIRHRYDTLNIKAKEIGIPCEMIIPQGYSPLGGPMLLKQIQGILNK